MKSDWIIWDATGAERVEIGVNGKNGLTGSRQDGTRHLNNTAPWLDVKGR